MISKHFKLKVDKYVKIKSKIGEHFCLELKWSYVPEITLVDFYFGIVCE